MEHGNVKAYWQKTAAEARKRWDAIPSAQRKWISGGAAFVLLGMVILFLPRAGKQTQIRQQEVVLQAVEQGDAHVEIKEPAFDGVIDFYDEAADSVDFFGDASPEEEAAESEAAPEKSDGEAAVTRLEPLGVLSIPKIDLTLPVVEGTGKAALKVAAGHVSETAEIGNVGNAVVAAHRSYTKGQFFNRLDELTIGDAVEYRTKGGETLSFRVYDVETLEPGDASVFDIRLGQSDLTLYTCTPVRVASHRLAVHCELVERMT